MIDLTTAILFIVVFTLVYVYRKTTPHSSLPPGPKGWPFVGFLDMIYFGANNRFHVKTAEWGKQYGGLYSKYQGLNNHIFIKLLSLLINTWI